MSDERVYEFLEHHGVPGMKWGTRRQAKLDRISRVDAGTSSRKERKAKNKEEWKGRSTGQKAAITSAGISASLLGFAFVSGRTLNLPLSAAAGTAAGIGAIKATERLLDRKGKTLISDLSN